MKLFVVLTLLATMALAGCTGSGGEASVPETDAQGRYVIHLTSANRFTPADAKVPVGATVVWVNDGGVHDVTAHDGSWSSDDTRSKLQPGQSFERTFDQAGTVEYHCALHASQGMAGTLVIEAEDE